MVGVPIGGSADMPIGGGAKAKAFASVSPKQPQGGPPNPKRWL